MLSFNAANPFPLLSKEEENYLEEKLHSLEVDAWLALDSVSVEKEILARRSEWSPSFASKEIWAGLGVGSLMTPYTELRKILEELQAPLGSRFIDLGAAYGRMGFLMHWVRPDMSFMGYEIEKNRVQEAQRVMAIHACENMDMRCCDLADSHFRPEIADIYLIYDFGNVSDIKKVLNDLRGISLEGHPFTVVGRGRRVRDMIEREEAWLSQVHVPTHNDRYSLYYSSANSLR